MSDTKINLLSQTYNKNNKPLLNKNYTNNASMEGSNNSFSNVILSEVNLNDTNEPLLDKNFETSQLNITYGKMPHSVDKKNQIIQAIDDNDYPTAAEALIELYKVNNEAAKTIVADLKSSTVSYLLGWDMSKIDMETTNDLISDQVKKRINMRQRLEGRIFDEVDWHEKHKILVGDVTFYEKMYVVLDQTKLLGDKMLNETGSLVLVPSTIMEKGQQWEPLTFKRYVALLDKHYKNNGWRDVIDGVDTLNNKEWVNRSSEVKWLIVLNNDDRQIKESCGKNAIEQRDYLKKINQEQAIKD